MKEKVPHIKPGRPLTPHRRREQETPQSAQSSALPGSHLGGRAEKNEEGEHEGREQPDNKNSLLRIKRIVEDDKKPIQKRSPKCRAGVEQVGDHLVHAVPVLTPLRLRTEPDTLGKGRVPRFCMAGKVDG